MNYIDFWKKNDPRELAAPTRGYVHILDSNKNAYFNFGVILYERRFSSMF